MDDMLDALKPHMTFIGRHLLVVVSGLGVFLENLTRSIIRIPFMFLSASILLVDCFIVANFMPTKIEENAERIRQAEKQRLIKEIWKK